MKTIYIYTGLPTFTMDYIKEKARVAKNVKDILHTDHIGHVSLNMNNGDTCSVYVVRFTCVDPVGEGVIEKIEELDYSNFLAYGESDDYYINECRNDMLPAKLDELGFEPMTWNEFMDILEG